MSSSFNMCTYLLLLFLLLSCPVVCRRMVPRNEVVLRDGIYDNLLIGIDDGVNKNVYRYIKEYFRAASQELYRVTRGRAQFGKIYILVPPKWNIANTQIAITEDVTNADIVLSRSRAGESDAPFVKKLSGCGKPGEYIRLTTAYLNNSTLAERWGPPAKTFVHEWAHYRWGVFDEFMPTISPKMHDVDNLQTLTCPQDFPGEWRDTKANGICTSESDRCRFVPHDPADAQPSYMAYYHLPNVTMFCDDKEHNPLAPTKQNRHCRGQSVQKVIDQHEDLRQAAGNAADQTLQYNFTRPTFINIERPAKHTFLFILHTSMPRKNLQDAKRAILDVVNELGDKFSADIFYFDSSGNFRQSANITSVADFTITLGKITNTTFTNSYCIGEALQQTAKLQSTNPRGTRVVLLGRADTSTKNDCADLDLNEYRNKGAVWNMLFIGSDRNTDALCGLARDTFGRCVLASDWDGLDLQVMFPTLLPRYSTTTSRMSTTIVRQQHMAAGGQTISGVFFSDESCTSGLQITCTETDMELSAFSPKITAYNSTVNDKNTLTLHITQDDVMNGFWNYTVKNLKNKQQKLTVSVSCLMAKESDLSNTIEVTPVLNTDAVDFRDQSSEYLTLRTEVRSKGVAVTTADVIALVTSSKGALHRVELLDNGIGADLEANDGVYSRYFVGYDGDGTYSVRMIVDNTKRMSIKQRAQRTGTNAFDLQPPGETKTISSPAPAFQRAAVAPPFTVTNQPPGPVDLFPPSAVLDLRYVIDSHSKRTLFLQFTAQGDELDYGTASRYEIRYRPSPDHEPTSLALKQVRDQFYNSPLISHDYRPQVSGTPENILIALPLSNTMLFALVLAVVDDANKTSELSNIIVVKFNRVDPRTEQTTAVTAVKPDTDGISGTTLILIVCFVVLAVVVLSVCVVCIIRYRWCRKRPKPPPMPYIEDYVEPVVVVAAASIPEYKPNVQLPQVVAVAPIPEYKPNTKLPPVVAVLPKPQYKPNIQAPPVVGANARKPQYKAKMQPQPSRPRQSKCYNSHISYRMGIKRFKQQSGRYETKIENTDDAMNASNIPQKHNGDFQKPASSGNDSDVIFQPLRAFDRKGDIDVCVPLENSSTANVNANKPLYENVIYENQSAAKKRENVCREDAECDSDTSYDDCLTPGSALQLNSGLCNETTHNSDAYHAPSHPHHISHSSPDIPSVITRNKPSRQRLRAGINSLDAKIKTSSLFREEGIDDYNLPPPLGMRGPMQEPDFAVFGKLRPFTGMQVYAKDRQF